MGVHGREWCSDLVCRALVVTATLFLAGPGLAQSPPPNLAQALAAKIAAAIMPLEPVQLSIAGHDSVLAADLPRFLTAAGIRVTSGAAVTVRIECLENLREQSCVADVHKGDSHRIVALTRPRGAVSTASRDPMIALELRPLLARRDPILDVSIVGDRTIVLTPDRIALYPADASAVSEDTVPSRPLTTSRVWPRDLRGRLIATTDGFTAYLPGVTCRGTLTPFAITCADESEPWPIGIENNGIVARRNYFMTPEGLIFYNAAPFGSPGVAGWIAIDERGTLMFLNDRRQPQGRSESADDVVGLRADCVADNVIATAVSSSDSTWSDTLRLFRVVEGRLVAVAAPLIVPGALTALWAAPGAGVATAVAHQRFANEVGRYEAFQVSLSCTR